MAGPTIPRDTNLDAPAPVQAVRSVMVPAGKGGARRRPASPEIGADCEQTSHQPRCDRQHSPI